jgi:hypothetical protein
MEVVVSRLCYAFLLFTVHRIITENKELVADEVGKDIDWVKKKLVVDGGGWNGFSPTFQNAQF